VLIVNKKKKGGPPGLIKKNATVPQHPVIARSPSG
jgi:hypothetical protein